MKDLRSILLILSWLTVVGALHRPVQGQQFCAPGQPCYQPQVSPLGKVRVPLPRTADPTSDMRRSQPPVPTSMVRIGSSFGNVTAWGSGTLIAVSNESPRRGAILTCAHILRGGYEPTVRFASGHASPAKVVATDAMYDLALLTITSLPSPVVRTPVAPDAPRPGEAVELQGYGGDGYARGTGPVLGYKRDWLLVDAVVRQGDSGGPIGNRRGLVGVISEMNNASGRFITEGACCTRIRNFIRAAGPDYLWAIDEQSEQNAAEHPPGNDSPPVAPVDQQAQDDLAGLRGELASLRDEIGRLARLKQPTPPVIETNHAGYQQEFHKLNARLDALEASLTGQVRYRLRRVPVVQ